MNYGPQRFADDFFEGVRANDETFSVFEMLNNYVISAKAEIQENIFLPLPLCPA